MPLWREILEMRYLWDTPHGLDGRALARWLPSFRATPLPVALRASLAEMGMTVGAAGQPRPARAQPLSREPLSRRSEPHRLPVAPRVAGRHVAVVRSSPRRQMNWPEPKSMYGSSTGLGLWPSARRPATSYGAIVDSKSIASRGGHLPARRVARGLRLLAVAQHAHEGLHVALRLHVAAHHAEAHRGRPSLA